MADRFSWIPYAALASVSVLVIGNGSSMGLWTTSSSAVKPVVSSRILPTPSIRVASTQASQVASSVVSESYERVPAAAPTSSLVAGGWTCIGAGMSLLLIAAARAIRNSESVLQQPLNISLEESTIAVAATTGAKQPPANLTLHVYDHCPYCTRVELFLGWNGIKYNRVLYGYGDMEGPKVLTGKKQLPVLQGDGVWSPSGMKGLPESLDIIAWTASEYGLVIPPATGRKDVDDWQKRAKAPIASLSRPRMIKMPYRDFQQPEDTEYAFAKWAKKTGFVPEEALAATPGLLVEMEALLVELEGLLKGEASLNPWGLGMDDILLLPDLRRLTCVKDLKWPPKVKNYLDKALGFPAMQCVSYEKWAF